MEEKVRLGYLYDFYGELLTEHQKKIYEDYILNDLSLSEIAEDEGVSRQAVHDIIKRCNKALSDYEEKLHLLDRFMNIKKKAEDIRDSKDLTVIKRLSEEIIEEL
ncbi:MAG: putative DNA-binding protein [Lachnospiraceae bacterium]|nr:putative DNA-binding protein [Lachnospiraceae bacterium]